MSIPISCITAIASGRTELGLVPALKTSKPTRLSARNNPSPIWLRAELPVHRTRIFFFVILDLPVREHRKRCTARIRRTREKRSPSAPAYPPTPRFPIPPLRGSLRERSTEPLPFDP